MDLGIGNYSAKGTFTAMDDKDNHNTLGDNFIPFKPFEISLLSGESKLPRVVGDDRLEYHCVDPNPTTIVTATHDVIEHVYSKVLDIPSRTYAFLARLRPPKVTRCIIPK